MPGDEENTEKQAKAFVEKITNDVLDATLESRINKLIIKGRLRVRAGKRKEQGKLAGVVSKEPKPEEIKKKEPEKKSFFSFNFQKKTGDK